MQIKQGRYQHYKGGFYEVIGLAKHSETNAEFVVYQSLSDKKLWVRPKEMFLQEIKVDNQIVPRFKFLLEK